MAEKRISVNTQTGERMYGSWDQLCDLDKRIWTMVEDCQDVCAECEHLACQIEPDLPLLAILEVAVYHWGRAKTTKTVHIYHQSELATLYV